MKPRRNRTASHKFITNIGNQEAEIASGYSLSEKGDMTLVAAAKKKDPEAFEILVERHARRVFFAARRVAHTREDAEDVVQQSLQKAFVHLDQFEGKSSFSTWLTRIAINEALILLRKNRGLREVLSNDSNEGEETSFVLEIPDSGPSPEDNYSQRERQRILFSALNELPHGMRRAIQLRELGERSVKARVFHGRRKLRERLRRYFGSAWMSGRDASRAIGNTRHLSQDQVACDACG